MSKAIMIGAACTTAAAGTAYYVSPVGDADLATPPILVDMPPEQALAKVRSVTAQRYLQAIGMGNGDMASVRLTMSDPNAETAIATISFDAEPVLVLRAKAKPLPRGRSEVDIVAELPDSRFSRQPSLHPHDLSVLAGIADLGATDYVSSILKRQRVASLNELGSRFALRAEIDGPEGRLFGERVKAAFEGAYGERLKQMARNGGPNPWLRDWDGYGHDPTPPDWSDDSRESAYEAARSASDAAYGASGQVEDAVRDAQRASRGYDPSGGND
jgi:hypothetical protein